MKFLNKLNGWERLWVLASIIYIPIVPTLADYLRVVFNIKAILFLWLVPVVIVFLLGVSVAWVVRGFKKEKA